MAYKFERILLLHPPSGLYRRDDRCQSRVEDQAVRVVLPPVDLALLGAMARRRGARARVEDYPARGAGWERFRNDLEDFAPDLLLFPVTLATLEADLEAARLAKEYDPHIVTVARGDLFDREGEGILKACGDLDMALTGEPEEVFERLAAGAAVEELEGVIWRAPEGVRRNAGRPFVDDLDRLPTPDRSLLDNSLYRSPENGRPLTVIKANRGCFARCVYCPAGAADRPRRLRARGVGAIVEELRVCVEEFGIRDFLFDGDTFTANKRWLLDLCGAIERAGLSVRWGCNSRVDTMDAERASALVRAGCVLAAFGVESGDQEMLDRMRKGTRLEQAVGAVGACREAGLATHAFYIIGLPWESRESLARTLAFMRRLDTDLFDINIATPLPGTEFYDMAVAEGLFEMEKGGNYARAATRSRSLSARFLTRWRRRSLLRLYARPRYVVRTLARAWRQGVLKYYVRAALGRLKHLLG